jgi:hypothetical protein
VNINMNPLLAESLLINEFYLTSQFVQTLEKHYLLHWTGEYFKSQITRNDTIIRDDEEYLIVLPTSVREKFYISHQLKLSFRKPKYGINRIAYVLVRFL